MILPSDKGATSTSKTSFISSLLSPESIAAWIAAPYATASSGLILKTNFLKESNKNLFYQNHGTCFNYSTRNRHSLFLLLLL